jgi:hypothetical protein
MNQIRKWELRQFFEIKKTYTLNELKFILRTNTNTNFIWFNKFFVVAIYCKELKGNININDYEKISIEELKQIIREVENG